MTQIPSGTSPPSTPSNPASSDTGSPLSAPYLGSPSPTDHPHTVSDAGSTLPAVGTAGGLATSDFDDGFADAVPFQALALRINRSRGFYQLEGDEDERSSVVIIPRAARTNKQYYGLPYDPKTPHEPSCSSPDGINGYGWIDAAAQEDVRVRACQTCPRTGYGAGSCDDLRVLLAYDIAKHTPVLVYFKNAEINARKGVFTLAVNRMRTLGSRATDAAFVLGFTPGDGPYSNVTIDVTPATDHVTPSEHADLTALLDAAWPAWKASLDAKANDLRS